MTGRPKIRGRVGDAVLIESTMETLRAWMHHPKGVHNCPNCGAPGVTVIDRSARPMAEWYAFQCKACGLDDALCLPLPTHRPLL